MAEVVGSAPNVHGASRGPRTPRGHRAGRSVGEVAIGVGTVDLRNADPGGTFTETSGDLEWDGLELASIEAAWSQPVNGTTGHQDFPEVAGIPPTAEGYLGPRSGGVALDLSDSDFITMRLWLYADYVGPPDFVPVAPTGHLFDLSIGSLLTLSVSDSDMIWEAGPGAWPVTDWHNRGYMDVDGRAIHDYCLANGEAPPFTLSRDFGVAYGGGGFISWNPWASPVDHLIDHLVIEWIATHTVEPVEGRLTSLPVILEGHSRGSR